VSDPSNVRTLPFGGDHHPKCIGGYSKEIRFPEATPSDKLLQGLKIMANLTGFEVSSLRQSDGSELPGEAKDFLGRSIYVALFVRGDAQQLGVSYVMRDSAVVITETPKGLQADFTVF
jgi:hypothetical protein